VDLGESLVYEDPILSVTLDKSFAPREAKARKPFEGELSLRHAAEMYVVSEGVKSLPWLLPERSPMP
jgi:hypothetical protein